MCVSCQIAVTQPMYCVKNGTVIMETTATCVERAQDYFYDEIPESYSSDYQITIKPMVTPMVKKEKVVV